MASNLLDRGWMESASILPVPADARPDRSRPAVDRESALRLAPPVAGRVPASLSFAVADALFSPKRLPFVLLDFAVVSYVFLQATARSASSAGAQLLAADLIFSSAFAVAAIGIGFYDRFRRFEWVNILGGSLVAVFVAFAVCVGYVHLEYLPEPSLVAVLNGATRALLAIVGLHLMLGVILRENPYRFTILGRSPYMDEVRAFSTRLLGFWRPYSHVPWEQLSTNGHPPTTETLHAAGVGEVVLTNESLKSPDNLDLAIRLLQRECRVIDETAFYIEVFERLPIDAVTKRWILERGIARRQVVAGAVKRTFDILIATAALTLLSPFLILIAISIKISSRGPILFVQARQGRHSVPFQMYKFRTMHADRGSPNGQDGFTKNGDERVTWIGRLLRPFHLDELPQLWNIVRGQMSLVGPRPEALSFAERMSSVIPLYDLRYLVRPGLTGYAQINQGYAMDSVVDTKRKLSYDLHYLCHHSIWTDLHIMIRTVFVLARGAR